MRRTRGEIFFRFALVLLCCAVLLFEVERDLPCLEGAAFFAGVDWAASGEKGAHRVNTQANRHGIRIDRGNIAATISLMLEVRAQK
jgi:hypothetical protein